MFWSRPRPGPSLGTDHRAFGESTLSNKLSRADDGHHNEERRPEKVKYPDSQQVFVGNLPNLISDFELRDFFRSMYNFQSVINCNVCTALLWTASQ